MNKDKIIVVINYILMVLYLIACVVLAIYFKFNVTFYYIAIGFACLTGMTNLIFMIIRLLNNKDYTFGRYTPALHSSYLVISVLAYYIVKNFEHYNEFWYLYWLLLLGGSIIAVVICLVLNKKPVKEDNRPRIISNKRK